MTTQQDGTNGQAKVLTSDEIERLWSALESDRDRALFGVMLYCGLRVSEVVSLRPDDIKGNMLVLPKKATKGKLRTRQIPIHPKLAEVLSQWDNGSKRYLFPGRHGRGHLTRAGVDKLLKQALERASLDGVGISTHSFRRTALTNLSNASIPLRVIQEISGHSSLSSLQRYLEVSPEQVECAIASLPY